jgi:hypothetical protein
MSHQFRCIIEYDRSHAEETHNHCASRWLWRCGGAPLAGEIVTEQSALR